MNRHLYIVVVLLQYVAVHVTHGQTTYTFTPTASATYDWTDGGNWDGNGVPVSATNATVRFFSDNTTALGGNITIDTDPATLTLNTLHLSGKGNGSVGTLTVSIGTSGNNWTLGGNSPSIFVDGDDHNSSRKLLHDVKPDISLSTNLVIEGNGSAEVKLSGDMTISGGYGVIKSGSGDLYLAGSNTFSGGIQLANGLFTYGSFDALAGVGKNIDVTADVTWESAYNKEDYLANQISVSNGATLTVDARLHAAAAIGSGKIKYRSSGTITNASSFTGPLRVFASGSAPELEFHTLNDDPGTGNLQFGGGTGDSGQSIKMKLDGDVGPVTLNNKQIEFQPKPNNWSFKKAYLKNDNSISTNTFTIHTDLANDNDRNHEFYLGGNHTGSNLFAGAITDSTNSSLYQAPGSLSLFKENGGKWILSGTNTYSGNTTVSAGDLVWDVVGSSSNSAVTVAGGDIEVLVTDNTQYWENKGLTYSSIGTLDFSFGSTVPSTNVAPLQVSGDVTFTSAPTVDIAGTGLTGLPLGDYPLMTWTGDFSGSAPVTYSIEGGGLLTLDVAQKTLWLSIIGNEQPLTWQGPAASEWKADDQSLVYWEDPSLVSTNYREYVVGNETVGDRVVFDDNGPGGAVTLNSTVQPAQITSAGTSDYTISGSGTVAGAGSLTVSGSGTLTLATSNSFTGAIVIDDGGLELLDPDAIGGSAGMTIANGVTISLKSDSDATFNMPLVTLLNADDASATIDVDNNGSGSGRTLEMSGGMRLYTTATKHHTFNITSGNNYTLVIDTLTHYTPSYTPRDLNIVPSGANVQIGTIVLTSDGNGRRWIYLKGDAGTTNSVGSVPYYANGLTMYKNTAATWYVGDISRRTQVSAGTMVATGTIDVTSSTELSLAGGELHLNNPSAVKSTTGKPWKIAGGTIDNSSGSAIATSTYNPAMQWNSDFSFLGVNGANSDLNLGAGAVAMNASRIVTVQNANATLTVGGTISGSSCSLTKAGPGALRLTGTNTYTGATTVNAGSLAVDGELTASSAVGVNSGATLKGNGEIACDVTISSGGTVQPGNPSGTLGVTGNATINGTFLVALPTSGEVDVSGILNITNASLEVTGSFQNLTVLANYGTLIGTFGSIISLPSGCTIDYNYLGGNQIALVNTGGSLFKFR